MARKITDVVDFSSQTARSGTVVAAVSAATEEYLVTKAIDAQIVTKVSPIHGSSARLTPRNVATPFPPRKL